METPRTSLGGSEESNKEKVGLKYSKDVKEGSTSCSAEKNKENGVRVPENGDKGGELGGDTKGLQTSGDEKAVSLDDDAEMNGISSLLQIQQSGNNLKGLGPVIDAIDKDEERVYEGGEIPDDIIGEDDEEGHDFKVGDFVWGKIKSHPWWPGRIYNPEDASDYAMKVKPRDRLLVAYFGDGTFAWCSPSQLKPFAENFVEMSGSSSSKNFLHAVEEAVEEVGKLVELQMTCSCVPEENLIGLGRSLTPNAGIKEGVLFPEGGIEKFSIAFFEPLDFIDALKCFTRISAASNMLELTVFKSWLSALYRAKGGYELPQYYDPQPVPGLEEDSSYELGDFNGDNGGKELRIGGPVEEDWHSPQEGSRLDQPSEYLLQKCRGGPNDNPHQRIKRKSIAEIMEKHDIVKANKDSKLGKATSSVKSMQRKGRDGTSGQGLDVKDENKDKEKAAKSQSSSKKRKERTEVDVDVEEKIIDVVKAGVDSSKSAGKKKKKKLKGIDEPVGVNDSTSKPRTRKALKPAEFVASEKPVSSNEVQNMVTKQTSKRGRKKTQNSVVETNAAEDEKDAGKILDSAEKKTDGTSSIQSDNGEEQSEKGFSPRERKKSKYLTFPYTNINRGPRKSEVEAESPKPSGDVSVEKPKTEATSSLVSGHSSMEKSGDEKKASEEPGTANAKSLKSRPPPLKIDQNNVVDPVKVKTPSSEILRGIRSAALSPMSLDKSESLDFVEDFCSAFRSSIFSDGSNKKNKLGRKRKAEESEPRPSVKEQKLTDHKRGRKRNAEESEPKPSVKEQKLTDHKLGRTQKAEESEAKALVKEQKQTDHSSSEHKSRKTPVEKSEVSKRGRPKFMEATTEADTKTDSKEPIKRTSRRGPAAKVQEQNEPAHKIHQTKVKKTREIGELSGSEASSRSKGGAKTPNKQSAAGDTSQLSYIKQKIEKMSAMLEKSDGKFSPTMKSKLESEMKGLLEEMNTMISPSP